MKKLCKITQHIKTSLQPYNNENGFILGVVIILSLMLAITVTIAIWSADNETKLVRNVGENTQNFYNAETSLVAALVHNADWSLEEFLTDHPQNAWIVLSVDRAGEVQTLITSEMGLTPNTIDRSNEIALLYIRPITDSPEMIVHPLFDERANLIPTMGNAGGGGPGMGLSASSRIFSITAITTNENRSGYESGGGQEVIQIGIRQIFPNED